MGGTTTNIRLTRARLLLGAFAVVLLAGSTSWAAAQVAGEGANVSRGFTDTDDPTDLAIADAGCINAEPQGPFHPTWKVTRHGLAGFLFNCMGRADFGETTAQLTGTNQLLLDRPLLPGAQSEIAGGFFTINVALEVSTNATPAAPCTAKFSLAETRSATQGAEQVFLDIPVEPGRQTHHVSGSIVEQIRTAPGYRTGSSAEMELYGRLEGGCSVPVTADVALSAVYTPLDGQGQTSIGTP